MLILPASRAMLFVVLPPPVSEFATVPFDRVKLLMTTRLEHLKESVPDASVSELPPNV